MMKTVLQTILAFIAIVVLDRLHYWLVLDQLLGVS
jgi:hypothetical protein